MSRLKSITRHIANQRTQNPGDIYEADESGAKLAKALGWAEDATLTQAVVAAVAAAPVVGAVIAAAKNAALPRRQYRRRDMTAK